MGFTSWYGGVRVSFVLAGRWVQVLGRSSCCRWSSGWRFGLWRLGRSVCLPDLLVEFWQGDKVAGLVYVVAGLGCEWPEMGIWLLRYKGVGM